MLFELHLKLNKHKRCYVTGSSGALGQQVCFDLISRQSVEVVELTRDSENSYFSSLTVNFDNSWSHDHVLVHCGWNTIDRTIESQAMCRDETGRLAEFCMKSGIKFIFVSSLSARLGAKSNYGAMKFQAELLVRSLNGLVIRPGLIIFDDPVGLQKGLKSLNKVGVRLYLFAPNLMISIAAVHSVITRIRNMLDESNWYYSKEDVVDMSLALNNLIKSQSYRYSIILPIPTFVLLFVLKVGALRSERMSSLRDSFLGLLPG